MDYAAPLTEAETREMIANFEQLVASPDECGEACHTAGECTEACPGQQKRSMSVSKALRFHEGAFQALRPVIVERFSDKETTELARANILNLFTWEPSKAAAELGAELYGIQPAAFSTDHMVAFAQAGAEVFDSKLGKVLHKSKNERDRFLAAVYFAKHETAAARPVLASCIEKPCTSEGGFTRAFIAATLLEKMGEPSRIEELTQMAAETALEALDAGNVELARRIAMEAGHGLEIAKKGYVPAAFFDREINNEIAWGSRDSGAEGVFQMIDKLHTL
jgi:hypothetical protein